MNIDIVTSILSNAIQLVLLASAPKVLKNPPLWFRIFRDFSYKLGIGKASLEKFQNQLFWTHQIPVDQTMRNATAQIQVVARKK